MFGFLMETLSPSPQCIRTLDPLRVAGLEALKAEQVIPRSALGLGLTLSGAASTHQGWHKVLPVIFLALLSIAALALFLQPGSMGSQT